MYNRTAGERISRVTRHALTVRTMLDDRTLGVYATSTDAGIGATLVNTGQIRGTFGIGHAFGTAVGWPAEIVGQAGACR